MLICTLVDQTICYTYDGDGDRVATTDCNVVNGGGGNTTGIISEFLYDIDHRLASQISISTAKLTRAGIYAGGEFLAEDAPDAAETGTPVATQMRVTDQVGSLRGRWDYAGKQNGGCTSFPYGDGFSCTNPSTALFTGKDRDNESALDYFGARYYSNRMGRFSSPDPSQLYYADPGNPQSLNLYSYALNSPLTNTDPTGLYCAWEDGTSDDDPSDGGDSERDCNSQGGHWTDQSNPCHGADGCVTTFDWNQLQTQDAPITTMIAPSKNCQAGPLNLSQNIQVAKSLAGQFWSGLLNAGSPGGAASAGGAAGAYVGLVQTGGPWDPKTTMGMTPENVAAGNINFGATCSQFGGNTWLGGQVCQYGAGIYGKLSGVYGSSIFSSSHGDIPSDNQQIRQGLAIAKKGGC